MTQTNLKPPGHDDPSEVFDWLRARVASEGLRAPLHTDGARTEGRFVRVPVFVEGMADAYENAQVLQALEDAWNDQEPKPRWWLFLVPSAG